MFFAVLLHENSNLKLKVKVSLLSNKLLESKVEIIAQKTSQVKRYDFRTIQIKILVQNAFGIEQPFIAAVGRFVQRKNKC